MFIFLKVGRVHTILKDTAGHHSCCHLYWTVLLAEIIPSVRWKQNEPDWILAMLAAGLVSASKTALTYQDMGLLGVFCGKKNKKIK